MAGASYWFNDYYTFGDAYQFWNAGAALGIEFHFYGRWAFSTHIGYRLKNQIKDSTKSAFFTGGVSMGVSF